MKRYIPLFSLLLASLLYPQSKMDINNLIDRGGLLYAPNKEKPFSGSVFDLYDNGQKKLNGRYRNGIKNGKWKWWNEDGGLDSTGSYKKGLMHGKWTSWYKNGIKSTEQTWKNGVEEGLFTRWYENGLQASEKTYKGGYLISQSINGNRWSFFSSDGKLIDEKCWDLDGNEIECSSITASVDVSGDVTLDFSLAVSAVELEPLVNIPNLIGQSLRSAELILQQAGLLIDTVYTEYNPEYPKGTISWQYPKANEIMKKGFRIQVTVSKGLPPDFYQVPNVIGLGLNKAKEYLVKARLKVGKISYHEDQDLIPYTVLDQSISEGTVLDRAMNIDLVVSILDLQDIFNQFPNKP